MTIDGKVALSTVSRSTMATSDRLRPLHVLGRSMSLIWRHKCAFGTLLIALWLFESQLLSAIEPNGLDYHDVVLAYFSLEVLRVALINGTYRALPDRTLTIKELVRHAVDKEFLARTIAIVIPALIVYTAILLLCSGALYALLVAALNVPRREYVMVLSLLWLFVEVPLYVLVPVAVLESRSVWHSFRRAVSLTAGHRRAILQLSLIVGPGTILQLYIPGASKLMPELENLGAPEVQNMTTPELSNAVMSDSLTLVATLASAAVGAVVTVVCYYDMAPPAARPQLPMREDPTGQSGPVN